MSGIKLSKLSFERIQYKLLLADNVTSSEPFCNDTPLICCFRQNICKVQPFEAAFLIKNQGLFWTDEVSREESKTENVSHSLCGMLLLHL